MDDGPIPRPTDRYAIHRRLGSVSATTDTINRRVSSFSLVRYSLQQHFADFRRPERFDTESEDGGYRFEVSKPLCCSSISKLPLLQSAFYTLPGTVGATIPEQFRRFPHSVMAVTPYVGRQGVLPYSSIVMMFLSSFSSVLCFKKVTKWLGDVLLHLLQLVR